MPRIRKSKLEITFKIEPRIAQNLLAAGFTGTTAVEEASDEELLAVRGIGPAMLEHLRLRP